MPDQRPAVTSIALNAEQSKRFISFFVPEAIDIVKKRERQRREQDSLKRQKSISDKPKGPSTQ